MRALHDVRHPPRLEAEQAKDRDQGSSSAVVPKHGGRLGSAAENGREQDFCRSLEATLEGSGCAEV